MPAPTSPSSPNARSAAAGSSSSSTPVDLLARSLATGEQRLLAEVHSLAFHYGWSEADILALPRPRRFAYLELLRDQLEGRPLTGAGV